MGHVTWSPPEFFSIKNKGKCVLPACLPAAGPFSFLGFWGRCTNKAEGITASVGGGQDPVQLYRSQTETDGPRGVA